MAKLPLIHHNYKKAMRRLAEAVAKEYPVGRECVILCNGGAQRIPGVIDGSPIPWYRPQYLRVRTTKRGTMMWASYENIELKGGTHGL